MKTFNHGGHGAHGEKNRKGKFSHGGHGEKREGSPIREKELKSKRFSP